jgi:hypothetical protein
MHSHSLSDSKCIKCLFHVCSESTYSQCQAITGIDLEIPGFDIGCDSGKDIRFFYVLSVTAGFLNQEKKG